MKKAIQIIAFFVVSLLSISAHTARVFKAEDGYRAPQLVVSNEYETKSLAQFKGKYVLVNFWSSTDAESRIAAMVYDRFFENYNGGTCLLSVNLDRSKRLFREIVRKDKLDNRTQFYVESTQAERIMGDYMPAGRMVSFLVNPQGVIIATNPTTEMIVALCER